MKGLDTVPRENWPPVMITFFSFRIMVGLGFLILFLGLCSLYARFKKRLFDSRWLHYFAVAMGPAGFVAVLAGWITTETGRQPFTVYGVLRTTESVSQLAAPAVGVSLLAFVVVYFLGFLAGVIILLRLMGAAPHRNEHGPAHGVVTRAAGITPGPAIDPGAVVGGI